jgi:uncharacterized membrane protein
MISELERQRVTQHQIQRERYLHARKRSNQPMLAADCQLLATRFRHLPLLLVTPFAILAVAGALDLLFLVTGNTLWTTLSFTMIPAGVVGGVVSVAVCTHDWFAAPSGSRVRSVGAWFVIGTALAITIFAQSWAARFGTVSDTGGLGVILGCMGGSIALMSGWLLGEYLDRLSMLLPAAPEPAQVERETAPRLIDEIVEERRAARA